MCIVGFVCNIKGKSTRYNMLITLRSTAEPLQYQLSSTASASIFDAAYKANHFVKNFNDFLSNPQQSTFTNDVKNNIIYALILVFVLVLALVFGGL